MEDLIYFLIFVIFAGISIISKIVNAKKKQEENSFTKLANMLSTPPPKTVATTRKVVSPQQKPVSASITNNQTPQTKKQNEMLADKKALIPEEEIAQLSNESEMTPISDIGEYPQSSFADSLKENRKFAIICHEILGKPKALQD